MRTMVMTATMVSLLRVSVLLPLICTLSSAIAAPSYPLGVHFGEEYITAARYTTGGASSASSRAPQLETVARVYGSPAYREYIADTFANEGKRVQRGGEWYVHNARGQLVLAPEDTHDKNATTAIFVDALGSLKAELRSIGYAGNYDTGAFSLPEHLNGSSRDAAIRAMMDTDPGIIKFWQRVRFVNAARLAYQLDSCEAFGMADEPCDIDDGPNLIILLDRNRNQLDLYVVDIMTDTCQKDYHSRIDLSQTDDAHIPRSRADKPTSAHTVVVEALQAIRASAYYNGRFSRNGIPYDISDVRAVVMSGDASSASFDVLRGALREAMPEVQDKLRDSIDPSFVPAAGAAYVAMRYVRQPDLLKDPAHWHHEHVHHDHDEL